MESKIVEFNKNRKKTSEKKFIGFCLHCENKNEVYPKDVVKVSKIDRFNNKYYDLICKKCGRKYQISEWQMADQTNLKSDISSAFKSVFGKRLEEKNFVKLKKYKDLYGRMIGDEILELVLLESSKLHESTIFEVRAGVATVYRSEISLKNIELLEWTQYMSQAYVHALDNDFSLEKVQENGSCRLYNLASDDEIAAAMEKTYENFSKWFLPELDAIKNIDDAAFYFLKYKPAFCIFSDRQIQDLESGVLPTFDEKFVFLKIANKALLVNRFADYLKKRADFEINVKKDIKKGKRTTDKIDEFIEELTHKINVLNSNSKYLDLCNEVEKKNRGFLEELF